MQLAQTAPTTVTTKFERPEINFRKEMRIMAERQKPPSQKPPRQKPPVKTPLVKSPRVKNPPVLLHVGVHVHVTFAPGAFDSGAFDGGFCRGGF